MTQLAFEILLLLLLCAPVVAIAAGRSQYGRLLTSFLVLCGGIAGLAVAIGGLSGGTIVTVDVSQWAPLPFALSVDRLSAFFLLVISIVVCPVTLFSSSYVERHYEGRRSVVVWSLLSWFVLSMVMVVTASTAFAFLFGWELMTLLSAGLIAVDGDSEQRRHSLFVYLVMMHAGAAAVFGAFLVFLPHASGLDFGSMRSAASSFSPGLRNALFLLAFVGFGAKAGIVPLHVWLPKAHPIAPTPVSALMSAVMLKTAIYGMIRFCFDLLGTGPSWWGYVALGAGALSCVIGILYALAEHDLKRLLAYSSVENVGIIYLALGASLLLAAHGAATWAAVALCAALLHTLNHGIFKSLLFLGAGAISDATHTLNIDELGGLLRRMPISGTAFLVGCCSIAGLPLFNGFVGEWLAFRAFASGAVLRDVSAAIVLPLAVGVLALTGGLAASCFVKLYGVAFLGRPRSAAAEQAQEVPAPMFVAMAALASACLVIGIFPSVVVQPIGALAGTLLHGAALPPEVGTFTNVVPWLALAMGVMIAVIGGVRRATRLTPTWACGLPGLDADMQYTSVAFSKPLRRVFAQAYRPERLLEITPADRPYFPVAISYRSVRTTSFEKTLYRPAVEAIVASGHQLRRLQTGNIQVYLLYIFLALVSLLFFMRFA
jgi:hydrogenase-4 component B